MEKLFVKKAPENKRTVRYPVMLTQHEADVIYKSANLCNMSVAEFIRSAALGRKTEAHYETEIVLQLSAMTREIRAVHADFVKQGIKPPEEAMLGVINGATALILKVTAEY